MSDELIELPEAWKWTNLGDISEIIMGQSPPGDSYNQNGIGTPLINGPVEFGPNPFSKTVRSKFTTAPTKYCETNDLILCVRGSTTGRMNIAGFDACIGRGVAAIRSYTDQHYLNVFIDSKREDIYRLGTGSTFPNVSAETLSKIDVPLPPLNEQKRIVAKIEELRDRHQAAKQALEEVPKLCDRFRQSVLAAAFRGDLTADWREENPDVEPASVLLERIRSDRRQKWEKAELNKSKLRGKAIANSKWKDKYQEPSRIDTSDLPDIPDSWSWVRAEEVCDFITKGTTPAASEMFEQTGEIPFVKVYNLTFNGKLDFSVNPTFIDKATHDSKLARSKVFPGDVLMNIVGPPLGKVSIVPDSRPEWNINQAIVVYRPFEGVSNRFLCYYLLSSECLFFATSMAKATAGQFNLTLEICRDLPLQIPPVDEQKKIVGQIDHFLGMANALRQNIEEGTARLDFLEQAILAKAFRGELVEQDPNDEPASVLLDRIRAERETLEASKKSKSTKGKRKTTASKKDQQLEMPGME